jgi:CheY-like chemotaxis protein
MAGKHLVLIVEDNEDFQDLYGLVAEEAGYEVERIYDGMEALERLDKQPIPTLVLLDSRLPQVGGDKILAAARSMDDWARVPIYILTADVRVMFGYKDSLPDYSHADGVIEKGAESIRRLRELFNQYR